MNDQTPDIHSRERSHLAELENRKQAYSYPGIDADMIAAMDQKLDTFDARRREFAAFLRSRRERLRPTDVGLPEGFRRRTPGLRREELAMLAGVAATSILPRRC